MVLLCVGDGNSASGGSVYIYQVKVLQRVVRFC